MTDSMNELMCRGMECLTEALGVVEAEEFINLIIRERFDYTQWQRTYFDKLSPGEFLQNALAYSKAHPYTGPAQRL